jgi:hypothetical protein
MAQASKTLHHCASPVTLATALAMAVIGACAGLSGMVAMFTAAFIPIGLGLEVAKLVAASRLHQAGRTMGAPFQIALGVLVLASMAMTIAGMYGYVSRHYADHLHAAMAAVDGRSAGAREHVDALARRVAEDERQVAAVDAAANAAAARGRKGMAASATLAPRRAELARQLAADTAALEQARVAAAEAAGDRNHALAEVQTIRYLAHVFGLGDDVETAVSVLSLVVACMWDPFAVLLLVSASAVETKRRPARRRVSKSQTKRAVTKLRSV